MYDLVVIGAGSGGVRAARIAASHGAKVAICESDRVGGTCVIRGCVPKKLLVYSSHFPHAFEDARAYGFTVDKPDFNWPLLRDNVFAEVTRLEGIYERNLKSAGVELFKTHATLTSPNTVTLASGKVLHAKKILLATGGRPHVEAFQGAELCLTSNEVFHLPQLPKKILIVGGGYIGVEFAGILNGLGVETYLNFRAEKMLRGFDEDLRDHLTREYLTQHINLLPQDTVLKIENKNNLKYVTFTSGVTLTVDEVLLATGRVPNVTGLGLENLGIKTGKNGAILVNSASETSQIGVYAVGDVTDRVNLTPVAIREGHAFADSVFGASPWVADHETIPTAVFSSPELGVCGLTQEEAVKLFDVDIYSTSFRPMLHTLTQRETKIFMKLVVDAATQRILGAHIMGDAAGEMIQLIGVALKMKATKTDFDRTMAVHPSAAEELVTMRTKSGHFKRC